MKKFAIIRTVGKATKKEMVLYAKNKKDALDEAAYLLSKKLSIGYNQHDRYGFVVGKNGDNRRAFKRMLSVVRV